VPFANQLEVLFFSVPILSLPSAVPPAKACSSFFSLQLAIFALANPAKLDTEVEAAEFVLLIELGFFEGDLDST
jgi:hypothetical protein